MSKRITNLATGLIFSCAFPSNKAPFSSEFSTRDRVLCTYSDAKRYLICWIVCMLKSALKIDCCAHIHAFGRGCRCYGLSRSIPLFAFTPPIIPLILFWFSNNNFFSTKYATQPSAANIEWWIYWVRHGGLVLPIFAHFSQFLHPLHCALVPRHQLLCNSVHNHMVNWMIFTHMILLENNRIRNHYWLFNQVRIRSIVTQSKNQNWFNRSTSLLGITLSKRKNFGKST